MNFKADELRALLDLAELHKHRPDPLHGAVLYLLMQMPHVIRDLFEARDVLKKAERVAWTQGSDVVDGVRTICEDQRGDLWRSIVKTVGA